MNLAELIELACASHQPVAYGWATVDVDRTLHDPSPPVPTAWLAVDDDLLGARGCMVRCPGGAAVVVLEPSTEGRLAAWLARHGEGWAVTYRSGLPGAEMIGTRRMTAVGRIGVIDRSGSDQLSVRLDDPFTPDE